VERARIGPAEAFAQDRRGRPYASAFHLAEALDWLAQARAGVINLSFAGPPNALLELSVSQLAARDIALVAAAGNDGPRADPAYPAAYPEVIAVTAVDSALRPFRLANRGAYLTFAAPGVAIRTAAVGGGVAERSGTSFAAPFATAVVASARARHPRLDTKTLTELLAGQARDLGEPGYDPVFGYGLIRTAASC
jgi:subtilisin family serine protease